MCESCFDPVLRCRCAAVAPAVLSALLSRAVCCGVPIFPLIMELDTECRKRNIILEHNWCGKVAYTPLFYLETKAVCYSFLSTAVLVETTQRVTAYKVDGDRYWKNRIFRERHAKYGHSTTRKMALKTPRILPSCRSPLVFYQGSYP